MKKKYAFTFIEVMIAIVIFSVGILAVLSLVTHNLKSMDRNNLKLQATLLAKEGIELVYNLRDSNIEKELPWNCLMKDEMYFWSAEQLSNQLSRDEQGNLESIICKGYFGTDNALKIGFDPKNYLNYDNFNLSESFVDNFNNSRLFSLKDNNLLRYGHSADESNTGTYFARYMLFKPVKENSEELPTDKILKIESHVLYMKGAYTGEVIFESFIGNY
ncbi:MAG TPA: prepilin-type N-terminal cleavage/methylation domain-containing protein [Candidatus Absconditabacterales bacterium]|nr:prepilin-type N-terminal cleavage/methylation domain-containing protein [Candidatus Absconditabacterales bacterium]HRU50514.1 prepilin-type N-terminal cleavage/methylation domain-containing protein [Candidatus Absconditabacterales bacterium]